MPREPKDNRTGFPPIYVVAGVSVFILVILSVVVMSSDNSSRRLRGGADGTATASAVPSTGLTESQSEPQSSGYQSDGSITSGNADIDRLYRENKLRVDDLDFWDMYSEPDSTVIQDTDVAPERPVATPAAPPEPTADPSQDGKHTLVERRDGTSEWVSINPYITKNNYESMNLKLQSDRMGYYEGQRKTSFFGVDISQYNGTVDYALLKEAEVDFVMIRLGARGYESGQIFLDENFVANITGANEAGLDVGVYFFSQAVTAAEASEEAAFVRQHLSDRKVTYPVVFDMEYINNDISRIEGLSENDKTDIAMAFLDEIKAAGYVPMLYGTKEWLVEQIDLTKLMEYDVWLSQQTELPDYPYQFQMWQYSLNGSIAGISGDADFNVCFVDYGSR